MSEFSMYPDKPELEVAKKTNRGGAATIFSLILFVSTLLLLFSDSLTFVVFLVLALLFHELGHYSFMKLFKYEHVRMLFIPLMGAFVQGMKDRYSQAQSFLVVLAGPVPGLFLGIIGFIFAQQWHSDWLMTLSLLLMVLNGINLLPLDPLDGGQLLKLLIKRNQDLFQLIISFVTSILLIGLGLYIPGGYMIVIVGFLMAFRVRNFQRNYEIRKDLRSENIDFESTYQDLNNKQYAEIKEVVLRNTPALQKYISLNETEDVNPIVASQVRNVLVTPVTRDASWFQQLFVVLIWLFSILAPIYLIFNYPFDWYFNAIKNW
ncbi:MAG: site-2 protease family protein [Crocinitomicaceae bacterium]